MLDILNSIGEFVKSIIDGLVTVFKLLAEIPDTVGKFLSVVPTPLIAITLALVALVIIMKVVGR